MRKIISSVLVIMMIFSMLPVGSFAETYNYQVGMSVTRTFSKNDVVLDNINTSNNDVEVTYTIQPSDIPSASIPVNTPPKEVVLILDVSGSMKWDVDSSDYYSPSRISVAKTAAENFVREIAKNKNIELSVITYNSYANYLSGYDGLYNISNSNDASTGIIDKISDISAGGGTNIGDAIRRGYQTFSSTSGVDRFFVFMTDGEPTTYSKNSNGSFYTGTGSASYNETDSTKALQYAKDMTEHLTGFNKNYFIAFSNGGANKLADIADEIRSYYKVALTSEDINDVYSDISYQITADLSLENPVLTDRLPAGLTVVSKPNEMHVTGQDIVMSLGPIAYSLNAAGDAYVAEPITVTMTVRADRPGSYSFGNTDSKLTFTDIDGTSKGEDIQSTTLDYTREPIKNFTFTRPTHASGGLDNKVKLMWDTYPGADKYKVYKLDGTTETLVETIYGGSINEIELPISATDKATTTYRIEAILADGQTSGKASVDGDTNPSILNLKAVRENNTFIVTWDQVSGATGYSVKPEILQSAENKMLAEDTTASHFTNVGGKIRYEYELVSPENYVSYDDYIRFHVDGTKTDATIYKAISNQLQIKQVITSVIESDLSILNYAKKVSVQTVIKSESPFPTGIQIYDPVILVELNLPVQTTLVPLEFTYSTLKLYEATETSPGVYSNNQALGTTVVRDNEDNVKIYITIDDYKSKQLVEGTDFNLYVDFAIAFESENGQLKSTVFDALRANYNSTLEVYQIEHVIQGILSHFYTTPDNMMTMKTTVMYNTTQKVVDDSAVRDESVGVSSKVINLKNISTITDEF